MFVNKCASLHQLKFSTNVNVSKSKTKYIAFSNPVMNTDNNLPLPYVSEIKHLGTTLQSHGSMTKYVSCAKSISKIHSLNQKFHYAIHPCIKMISMLKSLGFIQSRDVQNLLNSGNIAIRKRIA